MPRILLIEDEDSARMVLRQMLEGEGHEVIEARHGREALVLYDRVSIDIIITDIFMPAMDGIETIKELGKRKPRPKIIAISGGGSFDPDGMLDMAKHLGARQTLAKPFTSEEISAAIRAVWP